MIKTDTDLAPADLERDVRGLFELSAAKLALIEQSRDPSHGTPVFTVEGRYTSRGWTEWTQGFQFGSALLQYDAAGDEKWLEYGLRATRELMAPHLTHTGVHDHGFNNVSTYGNLRRLHLEGALPENFGGSAADLLFYELALKVSGAVQASRWTELPGSLGYICSFNGPHSLFADTVRSLRAPALAHMLGHTLMGERDRRISLLERLLCHAETTARYNVYFGEGRDSYDIPGRVAHESIFNTNDGSYRCPGTQQGYSPFSTWTRGLAWIITGFAEQLEFLDTLPAEEFEGIGAGGISGREAFLGRFERVARVTADFYLEQTPTDGIPYWDTGAPGLSKLGDYLDRPAQVENDHEPVDSSAAAIAAQGLLRLGRYLGHRGESAAGDRYSAAGLTVARTLLAEPYLSTSTDHQGLLLHSIYHRPNGWDHVPPGSGIPRGESSMWGDYHLRELALMLLRMADGRPYYRFF